MIVEINLIGTFNVLRLAATAMLRDEPDEEGERGICVNTASIAAYDGQVGQVAYAASKGGVVGLTLPGGARPGPCGVRVVHDRARPLRHAAARRAAARRRARRSVARSRSRRGWAGPRSTPRWPLHVVENRMLNGETIRLDGALRMAPR